MLSARCSVVYIVGNIVWCNGIDVCSGLADTKERLQNDVAESCSEVCVSGVWVLGISLQHKGIQLGLPSLLSRHRYPSHQPAPQ